MKKIALAIATLALAATPVLACPHMDAEKTEEAAPRTAEKDKAPKAKEADKAKDTAKTEKKAEKPAEKKTEKKADKVSAR